MLHLAGVKAVNPKYETLGNLSVTLDDIKQFRQLDSKCPGHPEYRWTSGVVGSTTTCESGTDACAFATFAVTSNEPSAALFPIQSAIGQINLKPC
jgi:transketolase